MITIMAFASRHDRHVLKHYVVPGLGLFMNIAELLGIIYLAVKSGGDASKEAYYALGAVVVWIIVGVLWVAINPNMRGKKVLEERDRVSLGIA